MINAGFEEFWRAPDAGEQTWGQPLWWTAGPGGELAVLFVAERWLRHNPAYPGWHAWSAQHPFDGTLVVLHPGGAVEERAVPSIPVRPSHIALLPGGRLLVAGGRSRRGPDGTYAANAVVYPSGRTFCLGDDIDVLVSDRAGRIWTAYGDEGIYGDHPQSNDGLAGWDDQGAVVWSPEGRLPEWPLAGFTGATEGEHAWLVWYSSTRAGDTFLTRIDPGSGEVSSLPSPVGSADGLAVRGEHAILTRRHHNQPRTQVTRAELAGGRWTVTDQRVIEVPGPVLLRCGQGRDGTLWLRAGDTWLRASAGAGT